jgi:hypothetical protein
MTKIVNIFEVKKVFTLVFRLPFLVQTRVNAYIQGYWTFFQQFIAGQRFEISQVQNQCLTEMSCLGNGIK